MKALSATLSDDLCFLNLFFRSRLVDCRRFDIKFLLRLQEHCNMSAFEDWQSWNGWQRKHQFPCWLSCREHKIHLFAVTILCQAISRETVLDLRPPVGISRLTLMKGIAIQLTSSLVESLYADLQPKNAGIDPGGTVHPRDILRLSTYPDTIPIPWNIPGISLGYTLSDFGGT